MRRIILIIFATLVMPTMTLQYTEDACIDTNISDTMISEPIQEPIQEEESIVIIEEPVVEEPVQEPMITPEPAQEVEAIVEEPIQETEPVWWTDYDLDLLAAAIYYEVGSDYCTDEHQRLTGQVVINRKNDARYPDTIYGVITDNEYGIQYSTSGLIIANAGNRDIIPQRCYDNALAILNGEVECPENVIFQANFQQGTGIYKIIETQYSTSYFCYG